MNGQTARLEAVRALIVALRPSLIVETGTFRGTTTEWLAQLAAANGTPVATVEISPHFHSFAGYRLRARKNVRLILGNSVEALHTLDREGALSRGTVFFYLDSHWREHLPLREELEFIFAQCPAFVVVVDDFKVEGDAGYSYDDYGPGKALTLEYLRACNLPNLQVFFPSAAGEHETGARRGSVFLTARPEIAATLAALPLLRAWPTAPAAAPNGAPSGAALGSVEAAGSYAAAP